jgi:TRAP-type C4-dicarboxylate transport system permease small subunit
MSLAVTVHFFGFLVPLAISVLAIHRALKTRRIDWDIFGALGVSLGAVALILPFKRAVAVFQSHYWAVNNVSLSDIPRSYSGLFVESGPDWMMQLLGAIILILIILGGTRLVLKSDRHTSPTTDEAAAILAFALLPIVGTVVGTFVTHTFQPKYAAEGSVGIFLLAGVFYKSRCRAPGKDRVILAVGALGILLALYQGAKTYRAGNKMDANFVARGPVVRELASSANFPIYMQNAEEFLRDSYYGPDYSIRKRLRLLYGREEELALHHTDSGALTAQYLQNLSTLKSEPFSEFCNGQPHLLLTSGTAWEWIGDGLRLRNATVRDIGSYMGGKLQSVVCR